jgi:hypothetical protein
MAALSETAAKAIEAYGGAALWERARFIDAEVSVTGLAFTLKRRPFFSHARVSMDVDRPRSSITPIGKLPDLTGALDGGDVRLENGRREILAERKNARSFFPYGRRLLYWDDLDMAYFANYAFWNYFTLPRLLMDERVSWTESAQGVLSAVFPAALPTHSTRQEYRFDATTGRLMQHNYNADIITPLATAAHLVMEHAEEEGLCYPSSRRVTPRSKKGAAMNGPVLIDIRVHRFRVS